MFHKLNPLHMRGVNVYPMTEFRNELLIDEQIAELFAYVTNMKGLTNEMVDYLNNFIENFDKNLYKTVSDILEKWKADGVFNELIDQLLQLGWTNVKFVGAKGDGETNDWEALQNAINTNPSNMIVFPAGDYMIDKPLTTNYENTQIIFLDGATIHVTENVTCFDVFHNGFKLYNANLNGNGIKPADPYSGCAVKLNGVSNCVIENCTLTNFGGHIIFVSWYDKEGVRISSHDNLINNNRIYGGLVTCCDRFNDSSAIMIGYSGDNHSHTNNIVSNNKIYGENSVFIGIGLLGHGKGNTFENNYVNNCIDYGIIMYESHNLDHSLYANKIINNIIEDIGARPNMTTWKGMGIYIMQSHETQISGNKVYRVVRNTDDGETLSRGAIAINGANKVTVSDNVVQESNHHGISLANAVDVIITDNHIEKTRKMSIRLWNTSRIQIDNNNFINGLAQGIYGQFANRPTGLQETIGSSGDSHNITNNQFTNMGLQCVNLTGTDDVNGTVTEARIVGNIMNSSKGFIAVTRAKNTIISENICVTSDGTGAIAMGKPNDYAVVVNNIIKSKGADLTTPMSINGTNLLVEKNKIGKSTYYEMINGFNSRQQPQIVWQSTPPENGQWYNGDICINTVNSGVGTIVAWRYYNESWLPILKVVE